jgi:bilin biosynthesis protein
VFLVDGRFNNIHQGLTCAEARRILSLPVAGLESQSDFYMAAAHLINCPCVETEDALIEFIAKNSTEQAVKIARRKAVEVLARLGVKRAVPVIGECLNSDDSYLVENAAWSLKELSETTLLFNQKMIALLRQPEQSTRVLIQALAGLHVTDALGEIAPFQDDERVSIKGAAIAATASLGSSRERIPEIADHLLAANQMDRQCAIQDLIDASASEFIPFILSSPVSPVFRLRAIRALSTGSPTQSISAIDQIINDDPSKLSLVHEYDENPSNIFLINEFFNADFGRCYLSLQFLKKLQPVDIWPALYAAWHKDGWNDYGAHYFFLLLIGSHSVWPKHAESKIYSLLKDSIYNKRPQFRKSKAVAVLAMARLFPSAFLEIVTDIVDPMSMNVWECRYAGWMMLDEISKDQLIDSRWIDNLHTDLRNDPDRFVMSRAQLLIESLH